MGTEPRPESERAVARNADEKIAALARIELFENCTKKELLQVAKMCAPVSVDAGFVLMTEGTGARECFVISEGKAQVVVGGEPVAIVGPGECVGEMALFDRGTRTATVTALTPMSFQVLSASDFAGLLELNPSIATRMAATLARRLRALEADRPL